LRCAAVVKYAHDVLSRNAEDARMNRFLVGAFAAALLVGAVAVASCALAAESTGLPAQNTITMNFQNVDIPVLAKFISEITGRNFIIDESVRGKVTIISPSKVTAEQAYSIFQSVLQVKGFTTVQAGKVIKIVPARNVRSSAALTESQVPAQTKGDEYVTRMVRLKNIDAAAVIGVIQPMVSHDGLVAAFPSDNTVIVTDDAYNVERLLQIIGSLDVRGEQATIVVIPLKLAFAGELAPEIDQLMGAKMQGAGANPQGPRPQMGVAPSATGGAGMGYKVLPDERTNCLIVMAPPLQMREIQEIVAKLDVNPPLSTSRIHVYRLKNAQALEMVQVLNNLLNGGGGPSTLSPTTGKGSLGRASFNANGGSSGFGGMSGSGGMGGMGGMSSNASFSGTSGGGGFGGTNGSGGFGGSSGGGGGMLSRGGSSSGTGSGSASASSAGKNIDFSYPVNITADPATNAMVISASPQDWQTLRQIIDDLDTPRVQIFVQAVIVEVSAERQRQLGVNFNAATNISGSTLGVGTLNFGQLQTVLGDPLGLTGLGLGLASKSTCTITSAAAAAASGTTTTTGTTTSNVPCDIALMTALETDTHADVLSAPTLLTADNEEAMIVIGENLPFVGSAAANAGLPGQIFNSVERQNVGITLDIVPQVSEGDYVKLDLYEEVSNVVNGTQNNTNGPTTTIRSASTTVLIQNHRTAVIGGLLASQDQLSNQGVPFISDIPVLGNLFSSKGTDKQKDNLIVFLTPHIVRNKSELRELALDERQQFVNSLGRKEIHDMPASQIQQVYKPSFSIPVSPAADLNAPYGAPPAPPGPENPGAAIESTPASGDTPFNTTEIGPTSMNKTTTGYSTATSAAMTSAPPYSASSARFVTAAPAAPLDPGTGKVSPGPPVSAAAGFAAASSALDAAKPGVTAGVTPGIDP
jgi:general secretion pathway protein D